jgi:hypothetical protein
MINRKIVSSTSKKYFTSFHYAAENVGQLNFVVELEKKNSDYQVF